MSGSFILQHSALKGNTKDANGRKAEAFEQAFIPQSNNRILVQTTRDFALSLTGLVVGKGSTGHVVEMQQDGQLLLVDFGLSSCVVRFPVGSDLIQFVAEAVQDARS